MTRLHGPSRRGALIGLACAAAAAATPVRAQASGPFASVAVDVGPLRAKGLGRYAEFVRTALQAELAAAFADRIARGGPRLVVRVDALSMSSFVGGDTRFGFGSSVPSDYLEGEALILGPRGEVLRRHPQLSAVPASSGGAWYDPEAETRRVVAIARHFAGWLRRDL